MLARNIKNHLTLRLISPNNPHICHQSLLQIIMIDDQLTSTRHVASATCVAPHYIQSARCPIWPPLACAAHLSPWLLQHPSDTAASTRIKNRREMVRKVADCLVSWDGSCPSTSHYSRLASRCCCCCCCCCSHHAHITNVWPQSGRLAQQPPTWIGSCGSMSVLVNHCLKMNIN